MFPKNSPQNTNALRIILAVFALVLLLSPAFAILQNGSIKIFAVTDNQEGMAADLFMYTVPGTGQSAFITSNSLVGKDTQTTGNIALQIAQQKTGVKLTDKDIIFDIRANASEVDGPSAGAAMALLAYSMFAEKPLAPEVALTGTINTDGSIGLVGGVGAKAQAASKAGIKLFMIPTGEAVSDIEENGAFKTVNLLDYGPNNLGIKVIEVSHIDQAIKFAYSNIADIQVDSNASVQIFIPDPISYDPALEPMKGISENYISNAKATVNAAKKALDQSNLPDSTLAELYQEYGSASRGIEMAQRFLDQNYLYSAANYAFNTQVLAGTVQEIADNPSLLSKDPAVLWPKISALKSELNAQKQKSGFISQGGFEWIIGAQQRLAYAEDALDKLEAAGPISIDANQYSTPADKAIAEESAEFQRVYEYVSAESWIGVAKDFILEAEKSPDKKIPIYSKDFTAAVNKKISDDEALIKDSNVSQDSLDEAVRRLDAAKISRDNNFLFAALYDAYFSDAFIAGELSRKNLSADGLYASVENSINSQTSIDSIWANLFFDHAKFYYQNALFNKKLQRSQDVESSLETSYDLLYLSKNLEAARSAVLQYIAFTQMPSYVPNEPVIAVNYNPPKGDFSYIIMVGGILAVLVVILIAVLAATIGFRREKSARESRHAKLHGLLGNLDKALSHKKITGSEYFHMRKKYEHELSHRPDIKAEIRRHNLSASDLRAKLHALENGMGDLRRHYKEGLILSEDYLDQYRQAAGEIRDIRHEIFSMAKETSKSGSLKRASSIKGTKELADEEERGYAKEKSKRKKILRRYEFKE